MTEAAVRKGDVFFWLSRDTFKDHLLRNFGFLCSKRGCCDQKDDSVLRRTSTRCPTSLQMKDQHRSKKGSDAIFLGPYKIRHPESKSTASQGIAILRTPQIGFFMLLNNPTFCDTNMAHPHSFFFTQKGISVSQPFLSERGGLPLKRAPIGHEGSFFSTMLEEIWVWVKIKPPGYGPQVFVFGSIYQGKPF